MDGEGGHSSRMFSCERECMNISAGKYAYLFPYHFQIIAVNGFMLICSDEKWNESNES